MARGHSSKADKSRKGGSKSLRPKQSRHQRASSRRARKHH